MSPACHQKILIPQACPALAWLVVLVATTTHPLAAQDDDARELNRLVQKLVGEDESESRFAEHLLVQSGSRAVPLLLPLLSDPDRYRRLRVVRMLGRIGEEAANAKKALDGMLSARDLPLQKASAISLLQIDPSHRPAMELLGGQTDLMTKLVFCACLARSGKEGLPYLMRLLRDQHIGVCNRAKDCLRIVVESGELSQRQLIDILALHRGPIKEAAVALAEYESSGPILLQLLDADLLDVRIAGLDGLAAMKNPPTKTADRVRKMLRSSVKGEAAAAARCLAALSPEPSWLVGELAVLLDTRDAALHRTVRELLPRSRSLLKEANMMARSADAGDRCRAAKVLAHVQVRAPRDPAIRLLMRLLQDPDAQARAAAAGSLRSHGKFAVPACHELHIALRDREAIVRSHAARTLGDMASSMRAQGEKVPMDSLVRLLSDPSSLVRTSAVAALARIDPPTGSPIVDQWIALLRDGSAAVRREAFAALKDRLLDDRLTDAQTHGALAAALTMPDSRMRKRASNWLQGKDLLLKLLDHRDPEVRGAALWTLLCMGKAARRHLPRIERMEQDPDAGVRGWASRAIKVIAADR